MLFSFLPSFSFLFLLVFETWRFIFKYFAFFLLFYSTLLELLDAVEDLLVHGHLRRHEVHELLSRHGHGGMKAEYAKLAEWNAKSAPLPSRDGSFLRMHT